MFDLDTDRTAARVVRLQAYLSDQVLQADRFICQHFGECRASHDGSFFEGQLHHVGRAYDLTVDGIPIRTVIVGQEYGQAMRRVSLETRRQMIVRAGLEWRFKAEPGFVPRNPHMKGTTSALRLLLGRGVGVDHSDEYVVTRAGQRIHIFECFALVNYLLCSAVKEATGMRGCSTGIMRGNCAEHFSAAMRILEPTVVLVQGKGYWKWVSAAFDAVRPESDVVYRGALGEHRVMIASLTHPSAPYPNNWGMNARTPYLLNTVAPAIECIRRRIGLPER